MSGTPATGPSVSKLGGTHYAKRAHRYDASKHGAATVRYATCGTWVAAGTEAKKP